MTDELSFDVLIIGSGLMGAAVARCLRDAQENLRIGMVDGGPPTGSTLGQHLHDVPEPEIWSLYNKKVSSGIQGFYAGIGPTPHVGTTMAGVAPGMYHLKSLGEDATGMPSAAVAWNVGGMGIHWTAATPTPWGSEINPCVPEDEWRHDLGRAAEILLVNRDPYPVTAAGKAVLDRLAGMFGPVSAPGRGVQVMPMAVNRVDSGLKARTSPYVIFSPIGNPGEDPAFTLFPENLATAIHYRSGRATGLEVRHVGTGASRRLRAEHVVVCADAIRTPQLLFASGIRPPALGHYLNEHAFLAGQVLADPGRLGFDLTAMEPPTDHEWTADCLWVPHSGPEQPYQFQVMNTVMVDGDRRPIAYGVGVEMYVPTEIRRENALEFSDAETDAAGMPRVTVRFGYSAKDLASIERARGVQKTAAELLGDFDPAKDSAVLPAGSSLHFTGTVRMGMLDDGTSVCDPNCRVWGFENLYVAGTGVIPTPLACNATLTGMTTAVRASTALLAGLAGG